MNQNINLDELDAETLYRLAREKEAEEERARVEANKERIKELKAERKAMLARHLRELADLDNELEQLGGSASKSKLAKRTRTTSADTISARLVEMIRQGGEMHTGAIRQQAENEEISVKNLSQTLAYLKRTGRLASDRRGYYTAI